MRYADIVILKRKIKKRLYGFRYPQTREEFDHISQKLEKYFLIKKILNQYSNNWDKRTKKYYEKIAKRTARLMSIHSKMARQDVMYDLR